jgi:hypothetical protein
MMDHSIWRSIPSHFLRFKSALQETDQWLRPQRMQVWIHIVQPVRQVALALGGCDIPEVARSVDNARRTLAILLILRRGD